MKSLRVLVVLTSMLVLSASSLQAQATQVTCKDGSKSAGGRGACSGHGGIAPMAKTAVKADTKVAKTETKTETKAEAKKAKADAKMAKAEAKADTKTAKTETKAEKKVAKADMKEDSKDAKGATAECKDHTYSHAKTHQGACSNHGGVEKWLDAKP